MIPELIARIDYFKGPYYASQGDFATAGGATIHYFGKLQNNNLAELTGGQEHYGRALVVGSAETGPGRLVYGFEALHNDGLGPWTASIFGRYFGPAPLIEDNTAQSNSTTIFSAQGNYELYSKTRLRFDVFNIFDAKSNDITYYYSSRLRGEPTEGVNDVHFHPTESRSFRIGLLYAF